MATEIHPSAIIDSGAELGADVSIGPFCHVESNTRIGAGTVLDGQVSVRRYTVIGANCRVHAGVVLGDEPQDLSFDRDLPSGLTIGDGNTFREGFTANRGTKEGGATTIGNDGFYMANSHVAHNCQVGDQVIFANGVLLGGHVTIGDGVFLSGNCVVHQFVRIGRLAMMSGLSGASQDLPPFCTMRNSSVNKMSGLNTVGLRRAGLDPAARSQLKAAFRALFVSGQNLREACRGLRDDGTDLHSSVDEMLTFIEAGQRGICSYAGKG